MASWTDELESRVQALTELSNNLQERLSRAEAGLKFMEGRLDGKKETTSMLISAFLSGLGVLISALLGFLNLSGRL